ncbi:MAG TPA: hypothetical protein VJI71_00810, partial [Candidatus Norongarragalinales archaeon]|nr:hypothetical protein [Candidatus Norongarragalinales archaeon]
MAWFLSNKDFDQKDERKLESLFKEASKYGAILALMHFDGHGKEADAVKDSLVDFISRLTKEPGVLYCKGEIDDVVGSKEEGFSSAAEVKVLAENFAVMLSLTMRYGPVAVEVLEPSEIKLGVQEMQDVLLSSSAISKEYASYVVQKVWGPEELEKYKERL